MNKTMYRISAILCAISLLIAAGCAARARPLYNVETVNLSVPSGQTLAKTTQLIQLAGADLGWIMEPVSPGYIRASIVVRQHTAVAAIRYTVNSFSIEYVDSTNLYYDAQTKEIHNQYNNWIRYLEGKIRMYLAHGRPVDKNRPVESK